MYRQFYGGRLYLIYHIRTVLIVAFVISLLGYILTVLKEKLYLKNNMIIINKQAVTEEHLKKANMKEFILDGTRIKAGDEIRVITKSKDKFDGILIGAIKEEASLLMVTHRDEIKKLRINNILKIKIISKYGQFFNV